MISFYNLKNCHHLKDDITNLQSADLALADDIDDLEAELAALGEDVDKKVSIKSRNKTSFLFSTNSIYSIEFSYLFDTHSYKESLIRSI